MNKIKPALMASLLLGSTNVFAETQNIFGISTLIDTSDKTTNEYDNNTKYTLGITYSRDITNIVNPHKFLKAYINISYTQSYGYYYNEVQKQKISDLTISYQYSFNNKLNLTPHFGLGYLDNNNFRGAEIDTRLVFSAGLTTEYKMSSDYGIVFKYKHYSNGGTNFPNYGLDFLGFGVRYRY